MTDSLTNFSHYGNVKRYPRLIQTQEPTLATSLQGWIKKLRAYAVAVTGFRDVADAALACVINRLINDHSGFRSEPGFNSRDFLFTLLEDEIRTNARSDRGLRSKAFVLIEIEGFTAIETAQILGVQASEFERWWIDPDRSDPDPESN